jgi:predicted Holliday junction resolvase-like endonuclease
MSVETLLPVSKVGTLRAGVLKTVITLVVIVVGAVTAYHATIYDLKSELATKADSASIEQINVRLTRIETLLSEVVATKQEQLMMATAIEKRLGAIEARLTQLP